METCQILNVPLCLANNECHIVCLPLKADVLAICIEKYRFLVFINSD
jgi:hypothetical protein